MSTVRPPAGPGRRVGHSPRMRWLPKVLILALPIFACSTREDPSATTTSTHLGEQAETESTSSASDGHGTGRLAAGALVEGDPRWLEAPEGAMTRRLRGDCNSLADPGWQATCERVTTEFGDGVWIREQRGQQERVSLYVHKDADAWKLALQAIDETGREFDSEVLSADLVGDGTPKVVVTLTGVDLDATDDVPAPVEVAVVEPSGEILVHMMLRGGRNGAPGVTVRTGEGLEIRDCQVDCVPTSSMTLRLISHTTDGWRVVDERPERS